MLENKGCEYFAKLKLVKIKGLPPEGWDDLTTEEQFNEIYKMMEIEVEINAVQFDY